MTWNQRGPGVCGCCWPAQSNRPDNASFHVGLRQKVQIDVVLDIACTGDEQLGFSAYPRSFERLRGVSVIGQPGLSVHVDPFASGSVAPGSISVLLARLCGFCLFE